jgi:hypothetical protein
MFGVGGTSPKTRTGRVVWWIAFSVFFAFVLYVVFHDL